MEPPRRIADKCFSIRTETYEDNNGQPTTNTASGGEDIGVVLLDGDGYSTGKSACSGNDVQSISEKDGNVRSNGVLVVENNKQGPEYKIQEQGEITLGDSAEAYRYQDDGKMGGGENYLERTGLNNSELAPIESKTWISKDELDSKVKWDTSWNELPEFMKSPVGPEPRLFPIKADYIDQGYPVKEFLQMFPERYSSIAGNCWDELPGYWTGWIGFMMLLNHEGTLGYLRNDNIWPESWWITLDDRKDMYWGNTVGKVITAEQETYYNWQDRREEEEAFLAETIAKMVLLFGRFDWDLFKWALRDEQAQRGAGYITFWKDWEYSVITE
ncbi:hypothetical protein PTTG_30202 [Puccinia triticina 1-1 BBBD Race 1]|uniref:Uncharacterized protein n=1 Tax=Puccinia triticina (isolate 1-1 / race 1 (BBBD)) TaxID=630390 RepID=A0A180G0D3_PUCT1|nr:hypothetical protein PTTG_30202 [Puccinia triticina 1-1 BBBD Race 1]